MKTFKQDTLLTIATWIEEELKKWHQIEFIVPNPDLNAEHMGYKAWVSLAELHYCTMLTPRVVSKSEICLSFKKLNMKDSFHADKIMNKQEKYGTESKFFNINKNEEPTFLYAYKKALESVKISTRKQILNLGINKADEFELIRNILEPGVFNSINFVGVDHSTSALNFAKKRFNSTNIQFYKEDINKIAELKLAKSDLIISIGTLQSPSINYKPFLMSLVQEHLTKDGAFILGFPNSRWIDSELIYGAKAPNYNYSEMSLLFNDVIFAKKYLQQKKFRVTITGREYIFLTATKISL
jgi:hypothetical protein